MKLLLTGASGFTGSHALPRLLQRGWAVRCYVRRIEQVAPLEKLGAKCAIGDLADLAAFKTALVGCDTLVNIASLGFGHADGIISVAEEAGIKRALFVSTTAIFTSLNASSKKVRVAAEQRIHRSRLDWTILRPTMIYGTHRDRNMCRLVRFLMKFPIVPVLGSGEYLMQPVHVDDLAQAIVLALGASATARRAYNLAGRRPLTYNEVIKVAGQALGRNPWTWHLPSRPMIGLLRQIERLGAKMPIKAEQIERLNEDKAFPWEDAARDFAYAPRDFVEGIRQEIEEMGIWVPPGRA